MTLTDIIIVVFVAIFLITIISLRRIRNRKSKSPCAKCPYKKLCETSEPKDKADNCASSVKK